jgi:hypothetical protein
MDLNRKNKTGFFNKLIPDIIALLFLLISGLKLVHGVDDKLDIPLSDEAFYIYRGLTLSLSDLHMSDWGILYSAWYRLLSWLVSDPVQLFYLNFKITSLLPPVIFYFLLRKNNVKPVSSLLVSWMIMISLGNLMTIPRVSHIGLIVLMIPFLFINPRKKLLQSGWILMVFMLIASYIRPEFMLGVILTFIYMSYHTIRKFKLYNISFLIQGWFSVILIVILCAYFFRLPWIMDQTNRGFYAICQHFFLNYASWNHTQSNSWYLTPEIIKKVFGNADSGIGLFTANPLLMMKHMLYNVIHLFEFAFGITFLHNKLILPDSTRLMMYIESVLVFISLLGWLIVTYIKNKALVKNNFLQNKNLFLFFVFTTLPVLIISIVIYPRWHYLIFVVYFSLAFISVFLLSNNEKYNDKKTLLLAGFILFALTRTFSTAWYDTSTKIPHSGIVQELKKVVSEVKVNTEGTTNQHFILDSHTGIGIFLMPGIQPVYEYQKAADLTHFFTENRIDIVLTDSNFKYTKAYKYYKSEWDSFMIYPCKYRFKIKYISIPGYHMFLEDKMLN